MFLSKRDGIEKWEIKEMAFLKQGPGDMLATKMTTHISPFNAPKTTLISVGEQLTMC